jgi:Tat protein secretion system quality control protein TatD with DNase activity
MNDEDFSLLNILYLEQWLKFSEYLTHEIVYGCCGISPMFDHKYDLTMEFHLRAALSNTRIICLGEIGIDLTR